MRTLLKTIWCLFFLSFSINSFSQTDKEHYIKVDKFFNDKKPSSKREEKLKMIVSELKKTIKDDYYIKANGESYGCGIELQNFRKNTIFIIPMMDFIGIKKEQEEDINFTKFKGYKPSYLLNFSDDVVEFIDGYGYGSVLSQTPDFLLDTFDGYDFGKLEKMIKQQNKDCEKN